MNEWWWTKLLVDAGHRFTGGEWRCVDCRRRVYSLLARIDPCESPTSAGFVFIGGPFEGEWISTEGGPTWDATLPYPYPKLASVDDAPSTEVLFVRYRLEKHRVKRLDGTEKVLRRYVFEA